MIIGLDPGTTTGIAVFNLEGRLVKLFSRKSFSRARISKFILEQGLPVIIATDRKPVPKGVERIASSFLAKIHFPKNGMDWRRKNSIARAFREENGRVWKNSHEKDAIVAGVHAWKRVRPLVERLERKVGNGERGDFVKAHVIGKGMSIFESLALFENIRAGENNNT